MEYIKGKPYFCDTKKQIKQYPYLKKDLKCDVLIIGGGIDGAILNFYLSKNFDVVLVDKSRFGYACTACATALLEYQLDDYAKDLEKYMPKEEIVMAYNLGLKATKKIQDFISEFGNGCEFNLCPTFLYSEKKSSFKDLEDEYNFRKENGFDCKFFTENNNPFPFKLKAGIYAENGGCEFNPYLFTKQMIENSKNQNKIFENTCINQLIKQDSGYLAVTNFGEKILCKKVILATGFNWEVLNKSDLCERFITYSIVTEPISNFTWHNKALIHDATSPYHYLRILPDNRIIYGGEDTTFKGKPINEKKTNKIYNNLEKDLFKMFPKLEGTKIEYKFCGSFGTTLNNLGLIGESSTDKNIMLFISCGANGIINAMVGTEVIEDILKGKENKLSTLFSPKRENI